MYFLAKTSLQFEPNLNGEPNITCYKHHWLIILLSTEGGANTDIGRHQKQTLLQQKRKLLRLLMHALRKSFGDLLMLTGMC